jgi:hypothetical protein
LCIKGDVRFDFHQLRADEAQAEFDRHGLTGMVVGGHRNIEEQGFPQVGGVLLVHVSCVRCMFWSVVYENLLFVVLQAQSCQQCYGDSLCLIVLRSSGHNELLFKFKCAVSPGAA